ncbi:hypothetical protein LTS10_008682 [Elasticomyces elasticus]|nr:hypothetical protein LTS10_008682 [Elasticomyces elasticus]
METILLPHLGQYPLQVGLFLDVQNAQFLRQQLLDGNTEFEYAFLDAAVLLCRQHVLAACFRAINDMLQGRMKSKNVHSEIVFSLSPNNNISECFRRFGVGESTKDIVAIKVDRDASRIQRQLHGHMDGEIVPFTDETLASLRDEARIRKAYKVDLAGLEAESFIVGSMALKGS